MNSAISILINQLDLPFLLIGGHSLAFYGYPRNTIDIHFLINEDLTDEWISQLRKLGYVKINQQDPFIQFSKSGEIPVDLMIVNPSTWDNLLNHSKKVEFGQTTLNIPTPEHLVALKLHSAISEYRSKADQDWEDIRQIVLLQNLDPEDEAFRSIILRYGDEDCLKKIQQFIKDD